MKKINVLLFVLILYCQAIHCQQFLIDSLQKILPTTVDPVQKIDLLLGLTRANLFVNGQAKANVYVKQAMQLAKKQNDKAGLAMAMLFMEQVEVLGARTTAIDYPGEALKIARSISSKSVEAFAAYHVAEQYIYERNDYKTGLEILHKALKKTDKSVPDKHIGNIHKVMARAYSLIGESTKTIDHFQKALFHYNRGL
jgi:Tfp pilus assembly protein PilF